VSGAAWHPVSLRTGVRLASELRRDRTVVDAMDDVSS
jgi:hypothetical protein